MISYEDATAFLENILEFPKTWKKTFEDDKVGFLRLYMKHHVTRIPFQVILFCVTLRCFTTVGR